MGCDGPSQEKVAEDLAALEDGEDRPVHKQLDDGLAAARAQRLVGRVRWQEIAQDKAGGNADESIREGRVMREWDGRA